MRKMNKLLSILIFALLCSTLIAQHGEIQNRRVGNINANEIKTVISNWGVIAQPSTAGPQFGWILPQNGYAGDLSILLGMELPIKDYRRGIFPPDGIPDTIHSVIITSVSRPGGGEIGSNGVSYTFEPLPGYFNPDLIGDGRGVAFSNDIETWPDYWPDHPEYGTGVWNGLYGPDNFVGDEEALFVMDDFNDQENQIENDFYSDSTNTLITGHEIEIKVRYVELNNPKYKDILLRIYDIKNKSLQNYHKLILGNLTGTYVGIRIPEYLDDVALYYPKDNLIVVSDFDNFIDPQANPDWRGPVGMFGESFIHAPMNNKIASFDGFVPSGNITMSDDEQMWSRITPGHFVWPSSVFLIDSVPFAIRGEDADYLWGSEYFSLNSGEIKRFVSAASFGYSKDEILVNMKYAEALYHSSFDTNAVQNSISITNPNYHKVVSVNETITWNALNSFGTVEIWYSPDAGNKWKSITKNAPNNGSYFWNTTEFEDGAFAKLLIFLKNDSGFIYAADESNYFTVNNSYNGKPFIKILNDELQPGVTITDEEYNFNLLIGDPENAPLLLKVLYGTNQDTVFRISQNINVTSDTSFQVLPISLNIIPNSERLKIKFELTDGTNSYYDVTDEFNKQTERQILPPQNFEWVKRYSEVPVEIRVIDSSQYRGEEYIISFSDIVPNSPKTFSVFNKSQNLYAVLNENFYPNCESLVFDGMTLYTEDILTSLDEIRSGWNNPHPQNLTISMDQYTSATLNSYRYPFNYKFVFSDSYSDSSNKLTSIFGNGAPPINPRLNFKVYRSLDLNWERIQFAFAEPRTFRKDTLSFGDISILSDPTGNDFSWRVTFRGDSSSNIPVSGDTLYLITKKGLSVYDTIRVYGLTVEINEKLEIPAKYYLSQNYPNPFNPNTKIIYNLASSGKVSLKVFDILGREVATLVNEEKPAGKYEANFNANTLASGVYIYQIKVGDFISSKKMILLK